jgi:hypothetical protein
MCSLITAGTRRLALALLALAASGCATRWDAARARFAEPDYVITRHFYTEAPQRLAVLPFAARHSRPEDVRQAEGCRRVFYQQMSLRDFEDVDLRKYDASVFRPEHTNRVGALEQVVEVVRLLDVVGMTTVLDLESLFGTDRLKYSDFMDMVRLTRENVRADAYVLGMTREYGRFYALLLSSVGVSTRVELRSAVTGQLLWRGEMKKRNYELPLTLNPLDVPRLLFDVWRNSRGLAMDTLAYQVYGELCATMPYVPAARPLFIETTRERQPCFRTPTLWMLWARDRLPAGTRLAFELERNGWYQCRNAEGEAVWLFRRGVRLVDADGEPVDPRADMHW